MNFWADCRCSPHCVQPAGCAADADTVTHRVFEANGSRLIGSPIKLKEWPANQLTIRNWIAIRDDIAGVERERYDTKLATGILAQAHAVDQSTCGSVFRSAGTNAATQLKTVRKTAGAREIRKPSPSRFFRFP
jgi:hypothetical protein